MKPRVLALLVVLLVLALAPPAVVAQSVSSPAECFRDDFHTFLDDLARLPGFPPADVAAARDAFDAATPGQQEQIRAQLESTPAWRGLPEIIASFSAADIEFRRQELARLIDEGMRPPGQRAPDVENAERMRRTMLFMIEQLRALAPVVGAQYAADLDIAHAQIASLPASALPQMYALMAQLAKSLQQGVSGGEGLVGPLAEGPIEAMASCSSGCSWDPTGACKSICEAVSGAIQDTLDALQSVVDGFITAVTGPVNSIITAVANLPTTITSAFNGLYDRIKTFLTAAITQLCSLIPDSVTDVFNSIVPAAAKSVAAIQQWIASAPTVPDLCPSDEVLAVVADVCGRGAGELTELFVKLAPGDTPGLPFKIPILLVDSGVKYLCMCADQKEAAAFDAAQAGHRDYTETHLNLKLSLLATATSVSDLNLSLGALDQDVSAVEAKVDALGVEAADLKAALLEEETYLHGFRDLLVRVKVEENLLENAPDVVSTYQLPAAYGGMLEGVRTIAWSTFHNTEGSLQTTNGALRELQRADALFAVGNFVKAYAAYRSAYVEAVK